MISASSFGKTLQTKTAILGLDLNNHFSKSILQTILRYFQNNFKNISAKN